MAALGLTIIKPQKFLNLVLGAVGHLVLIAFDYPHQNQLFERIDVDLMVACRWQEEKLVHLGDGTLELLQTHEDHPRVVVVR